MTDDPTDPDQATLQAKAKAAARKAARAAVLAERQAAQAPVVAASGGVVRAMPAAAQPDLDVLKLRDLVEAAVEARDLKKPAARAAIEAALEVLGTAIAQGREVNLPGLGKVKIKRTQVRNGQRISELRLRQKLDEEVGNQRVAEDGEEG